MPVAAAALRSETDDAPSAAPGFAENKRVSDGVSDPQSNFILSSDIRSEKIDWILQRKIPTFLAAATFPFSSPPLSDASPGRAGICLPPLCEDPPPPMSGSHAHRRQGALLIGRRARRVRVGLFTASWLQQLTMFAFESCFVHQKQKKDVSREHRENRIRVRLMMERSS